MNRTVERYVNYLILTGFFLLGAGMIVSIIDQIRYGMPIEMVMIMTGLVLIVLCFIIAKVFGEVFRWKA
jgi:VIT1/CCC1 family predicted Fe2+/Mn2+ transporter